MGGTFISEEIRINPTSAQAERRLHSKFARIQQSCEIEYGTDPYNGTWSTIYELKVNHNYPAPKRWTKKAKYAAYEWAENKLSEDMNKGGAIAIPANGCYLVIGYAAT